MKFKLINSIDPLNKLDRVVPGGMGLQNVKKRLELLYHGKYKLDTKKLEEVFVINLELELELLEDQYTDSLQLTKTL
jgi:sensor histidine kinase YesM